MPGTLITLDLTGTYLVRGDVSGFEFESLAGVTVTVTNLTTNEDSTSTVGEGGAYSVDLGDTTAGAYPAGYSVGDEISITCTHRDVTRTWKRRVASDELVQDVYFTHGTWLGALRKAKLVGIEVPTATSGFTVTLRDAHTRDVVSVTKNGVLLASSAYAFTRPSTLTMTNALSSSDVLEVEKLLHRSEQDAKTAIVNDGDAPVRNATARYYATPLPTRAPELQDLSESLAAAALRDRVYAGAERPDEDARNLRKTAQKALDELRTGERSLTDQDGAFITPTAQSTTTPQSSLTPTRRHSRFTDDNAKVTL